MRFCEFYTRIEKNAKRDEKKKKRVRSMKPDYATFRDRISRVS